MDQAMESLKSVLKSLGSGVAVVNARNWEIAFENATFFKWFPPGDDADGPLTERLSDFNTERAATRLAAGRPYRFETETRSGARTTPIAVNLRPLEDSAEGLAMVECVDISKQKEAEYMLETYSGMAEKNARELEREKERVEKLLLNVMPKSVYEELKDYGTTTPARFDNASVLMLDFVDFTEMSISRDPSGLVAELNDIFSAFDRIVELFGCERIKTIGDAYLAVSGVPEKNPDHAQNIAKVALRMRRYLERRNAAHREEWLSRIGICSGPVVGSVVGIHKYVYDIFGPAVNLAARLESECEPMQIALDEQTWRLIRDDFACTEVGSMELKGFGEQKIFHLNSEVRRGR